AVREGMTAQSCPPSRSGYRLLHFSFFYLKEAIPCVINHDGIETGKKGFANRELRLFSRPDEDVLHAESRHRFYCRFSAGINRLHIVFALSVVDAVRPQMAGITHYRLTARQRDEGIVNWRVQDHGARWYFGSQ